MTVIRTVSALSLVLAAALLSQATPKYTNFEGSPVNPIRLSADLTRLYVINNPACTLSVFDVTTPASPVKVAEIPVGIEPVSVAPNPYSTVLNDEAWVVNQESDSISVVSVSKGIVTDTIAAKDEPADILFANGYAFVSISRLNVINVYNATTHKLLKSISVFGGLPKALALSPDGTTVYSAFRASGNQTTSIPYELAGAYQPTGPPQFLPIPLQDYITTYNNPAFSNYVNWTMPDNDVVAINTTSLAITGYFNTVGTNNFNIAVQPSTGNLYVTNTDATNQVQDQPTMCGTFYVNRVSKVTPSNTVVAYVLDPASSIHCAVDTNALSLALSQPTNIVFDGTGNTMYIAAFGTDRIAQVDTSGNILARIDINQQELGATVAPATKRGPRGLAINNTANILYEWNRISNTFSIINTASNTVVAWDLKTGASDPTPSVISQGRGFLYDAKLSGNGSVSCSSCHTDAEADHLAWDLNDPDGTYTPVTLNTGNTYEMNPMKGSMTTQPMRGLANTAPYHWRGDKAAFSDFNEAFAGLLGGNQLSSSDMTAYTNFINTIVYMPNPYQNLDRSYPTNLHNGNAQNGLTEFQTVAAGTGGQTCISCHALTGGTIGSDLSIRVAANPQPLKIPQLRFTYTKLLFNHNGPTIDGFGLNHGGDTNGLFAFLSNTNGFPGLQGQTQDQLDLAALSESFDTGMAPAVGYTRTMTSANVSSSSIVSDWATLEAQAAAGNCSLIAEGSVNGSVGTLVYNPTTATYTNQHSGTTYTHAQVAALVQGGATFSIMGTPLGGLP